MKEGRIEAELAHLHCCDDICCIVHPNQTAGHQGCNTSTRSSLLITCHLLPPALQPEPPFYVNRAPFSAYATLGITLCNSGSLTSDQLVSEWGVREC
jgi:hypothetical protein